RNGSSPSATRAVASTESPTLGDSPRPSSALPPTTTTTYTAPTASRVPRVTTTDVRRSWAHRHSLMRAVCSSFRSACRGEADEVGCGKPHPRHKARGLAGRLDVGQHRRDAPIGLALVEQAELEEDRADVLLDRPLAHEERAG